MKSHKPIRYEALKNNFENKRLDKSILANAMVLSAIVYNPNPYEALTQSLLEEVRIKHSLSSISTSNEFGGMKFIVAKDETKKSNLYFCFRGTENIKNIKHDLMMNPTSNGTKGRFHKGFLEYAKKFPLNYAIKALKGSSELPFLSYGFRN